MTAAMLLAAGYGTRLRPLTEFLPKPLVPVGNRALLDWHLDSLAALGAASVALNVSHLGERIASHVADRGDRAPQIELIHEKEPLGTGGGLLGARHLLAGENRFLVINADVFHTIDLAAALDAHERSGADATLVVRRARRGEPHDELTVDREGIVRGGPREGGVSERWRFAGIHVLTPAVFGHLSARGTLIEAYEGLLVDGAKIMAFDCGESTWFDVGTPVDYLEANRAAVAAAAYPPSSLQGVEIIEPVLAHPSARIGAGCTIGSNVVVGEGALVGPASQLSDSVVWPGVSIPAGSMLRGCVAHCGGVLTVTGGLR